MGQDMYSSFLLPYLYLYLPPRLLPLEPRLFLLVQLVIVCATHIVEASAAAPHKGNTDRRRDPAMLHLV